MNCISFSRVKRAKTYRNPIFQAKEYKNHIDSGYAKNEADLARKLNISRVRVNQFISLLKLENKVIKILEDIGELMQSQFITERKLRPLVKIPAKKQLEFIKQLIIFTKMN